jgi:hypothetical protein
MSGGVLMAIVMVLVIPVGVMLTGAVWSAALGWFLNEPADSSESADSHE